MSTKNSAGEENAYPWARISCGSAMMAQKRLQHRSAAAVPCFLTVNAKMDWESFRGNEFYSSMISRTTAAIRTHQ